MLVVCFALLFSGCGESKTQSDTDKVTIDEITSTQSTNDVTSNEISSPQSSQSVSQNESSQTTVAKNPYSGVERTVLASKNQLKMDCKKLPDIEGITQEQINKCMLSDGMVVTVTNSSEFKAKDAKAAIKMTVNKNKGSGQVIFAEKLAKPLSNGLDEAIVLDPVDGSLEGYEGIRYYVKVKRPEGKKYSELKLRFFFGSYSYYRSMYEYTTTLPDGDFEGYITVPFSEMVNGYNGNTAVSITNIAYFAFNMNLEGNAEGLEIYVSDFQAYRELYW